MSQSWFEVAAAPGRERHSFPSIKLLRAKWLTSGLWHEYLAPRAEPVETMVSAKILELSDNGDRPLPPPVFLHWQTEPLVCLAAHGCRSNSWERMERGEKDTERKVPPFPNAISPDSFFLCGNSCLPWQMMALIRCIPRDAPENEYWSFLPDISWGAFPWWWIGPGKLHVASAFQMDDPWWVADPCIRQVPAAKSRRRCNWFAQRCSVWDMKWPAHSWGGMAKQVECSASHTAELGLPTGSVLHTRSCPHSQSKTPNLESCLCQDTTAFSKLPWAGTHSRPAWGPAPWACSFCDTGHLGQQAPGPLSPRKSKCLHENVHREEGDLWWPHGGSRSAWGHTQGVGLSWSWQDLVDLGSCKSRFRARWWVPYGCASIFFDSFIYFWWCWVFILHAGFLYLCSEGITL